MATTGQNHHGLSEVGGLPSWSDNVVEMVMVDVVKVVAPLTVSVTFSFTLYSPVTFFTTGKRNNGYGQRC